MKSAAFEGCLLQYPSVTVLTAVSKGKARGGRNRYLTKQLPVRNLLPKQSVQT